MIKSEDIKELAIALVKAQVELKPVAKDSTNPHFKNRFASLEAVIDATRIPLMNHGLAILQTHAVLPEGGTSLVTTLIHVSGQFITSTLPLILQKNDMQGLASATSYARRNSLLAILNLAATDDDAEASVKHDDGTRAIEGTQTSQVQVKVQSGLDAVAMFGKKDGIVSPKAPIKGYPSEAQQKRLYAICKSHNWNESMLNDFLRSKYGISDKSQIATRQDYDTICKYIDAGNMPQNEGVPPPTDDDHLPF